MDSSGSKNYQYLIDTFGREKISARFQLLLDKTDELIQSHCRAVSNDNLKNYFLTNDLIIQDIVINYFADIDRLKKFHGIDKVNSIKIASYTGYWYARLKPIQIVKNLDETVLSENRLLFTKINEKVALGIMLGIAFDASDQYIPDPNTTKFYIDTVYNLTYRTNTSQSLEIMLTAHCCNPNHPIMKMED